MKIGAGILGILWGIIAFLTFGIGYGGVHSLIQEIKTGTGPDAHTAMIEKYVGIGLPLLALGGGMISFGQGFIGGLMMLGSAAGIYWKCGQTFLGLVLAGPLAIAGLVAIVGQFTGGRGPLVGR